MSEDVKRVSDLSKHSHCHHCVDVDSDTLPSCESEAITPSGLNPNDFTPFVVDTPVVLAQRNIQIQVASKIKLPYDALEIQSVKNKLKIVQCMLMQAPAINCPTNDMELMLFIRGFVRKKIDYTAPGMCKTHEGICGDLQHCTVDVPFESTTPISFVVPPERIIPTTSTEFEFFKREELPPYFPEKDKLLSADLSEYNQVSTEHYNNLPYCKLIRSRIIEYNEYLNRQRGIIPGAPFEERKFKEFMSRMVINVVVKVLQDRQVGLNLT